MATQTVNIKTNQANQRASLTFDPGGGINQMATLNVTNGTGRSKTTTSYEQYDDGRFYNASTGEVWTGESNGAADEVRAAQGSAINTAGVAPEVMSGYADTGLEMGLDQTKTQALSSGGAGGKGNDKCQTVSNPTEVITQKAPRRTNYGNLRYPDGAWPNNNDFMKITMYEYKPGQFDTKQRASERISKSLGTVVLPIPNGLTDANAVGWGQQSMNNLQMGGLAAAKDIMDTDQKFLDATVDKASELLEKAQANAGAGKEGAKSLLLSKLPGINASPNEILGRQSGKVLNPNMELLFNGPSLRSFNYTFRLTPRSNPESGLVRRIIRFFKQGMSVKGSPGGGMFLDSPNVFGVTFHAQGGSTHNYLHKLKKCALQNFTVNYIPDGTYMTLPNSSMTAYEIGLTLMELDPIFDADYGSDTDIGF